MCAQTSPSPTNRSGRLSEWQEDRVFTCARGPQVSQLKKAKQNADELISTVKCKKAEAALHCIDCSRKMFCKKCFNTTHAEGEMKLHIFR